LANYLLLMNVPSPGTMPVNRRAFLKASAVQGAVALLAGPALLRAEGTAPQSKGLCVTICNHWSYIGIGWQLGIESCVLSATDAMELADRAPHAKTCLNLDARAYEFMAEKFPEVTDRLRRQLAAGKLELIGGTYGQPMGTTLSGESNIRQMIVGREVIRKALGYDMVTFLEEEEFTHPQVPQMAALAGYRYASLAQLDTWGRAGCPRHEFNVVDWKGIDGTTIRCVPKNSLFGYSPDLKKLVDSDPFKKLQALGKPLLFTWEEFGWESPEQPTYLTAPARYQALAEQQPVEFVTLKEYLDKHGTGPQEVVTLRMDDWDKSLTWGLGGDQVRIMDRKVEGLLLAAEMFDAVAYKLGARTLAQSLGEAWKHLLASQSHDVGLCEYSRWQGDRMAPANRLEDNHNFTWGTIGYQHLDAAQQQAQPLLDASLKYIAAQTGAHAGPAPTLALTVFNPLGWPRTDLVTTGRIYPIPGGTQHLSVRNREGKAVPSQVIRQTQDADGNLVVAELAFAANDLPSVGYDTYYLDYVPGPTTPGETKTTLHFDQTSLVLENEHLRVRLDSATGGVAGLLHKPTGQEMLNDAQGAFPRLTGRPNPNLSRKPNPPAFFDTAKSKAKLDWLAQGPLQAEVRARHSLPYLEYETRVSLTAGAPYVEVYVRLLCQVPPHSDAAPANIKEGYWLSIHPAFPVTEVLRDFPFGIEETRNSTFHALTFVDLLGKDCGLLVLHPGTQFFRRDEHGVVGNLVMREWESHFTREYGWPIYAEYHYRLMPHAPGMTHSERLRAANAFSRPPLCVAAPAGKGNLPPRKSFLEVAPNGVQLSTLRHKPDAGLELRLVEVEGQRQAATLKLGFPVQDAVETDLLGNKLADAPLKDGAIQTSIEPWKIRTFSLR
jgi:alpha-mannosidase